jgi:16S rRNA C967 or C1407 C5-methylase (RsmB/RsmF family)
MQRNTQENEMVIAEFLKHNPEYKLVDAEPRVGSGDYED